MCVGYLRRPEKGAGSPAADDVVNLPNMGSGNTLES